MAFLQQEINGENKPGAHSCREIKLRTEICGRIQTVLRFPAPLSQGPKEVSSYFLDNDWKRVKKGKTWNIWQSLCLPAKAKLSLKQYNVIGSRGPRAPSLPSTWEPHSSFRAWQLQMLTQAIRVYTYKQPSSVKWHNFHFSSQLNSIFWE